MSSNNKVDKNGLSYFWNKATAYIQEALAYTQDILTFIGNTPMGTVATTITGAIKQLVDNKSNLLYRNEVVKTMTATKSADTRWTITATKTGYTPVMWELQHNYSTAIITAIETVTVTEGSLELTGFARILEYKEETTLSDVRLKAQILWVKNS